MPAKATRKVTTNGPASRAVILPPDWLHAAGVDKGTPLELRYGGDLLLIVPPGREAMADRLVKAVGGML